MPGNENFSKTVERFNTLIKWLRNIEPTQNAKGQNSLVPANEILGNDCTDHAALLLSQFYKNGQLTENTKTLFNDYIGKSENKVTIDDLIKISIAFEYATSHQSQTFPISNPSAFEKLIRSAGERLSKQKGHKIGLFEKGDLSKINVRKTGPKSDIKIGSRESKSTSAILSKTSSGSDGTQTTSTKSTSTEGEINASKSRERSPSMQYTSAPSESEDESLSQGRKRSPSMTEPTDAREMIEKEEKEEKEEEQKNKKPGF